MGDKKYAGAPFGTQTARFDVSGVHPQNKMPGTYTEVPYCKKATSKENRLLGPGTYCFDTGDFSERAVWGKARGPNWEWAFQLARLSAIPHALFRREWEQRKHRAEQLGPGRYSSGGFVEELSGKPGSNRGVCQSRGSRFPPENKFHSKLPGPGSYGEGGVPWAAMEKKAQLSQGTFGMLEAGEQEIRRAITVGSDLAPGQYRHTAPLEELLNKKTSTRGPYDLYSGERYQVPKSQIQNRHLGPGRYNLRPFTADLSDTHHGKHGEFGNLDQYAALPTERIYCSTLSQWPRRKVYIQYTHSHTLTMCVCSLSTSCPTNVLYYC
ncbi:Lymphocyte expansion molecule [Geodia barretti]|uniref:Lymphocyte expansion molecule n=1 Tax=Geodia barretti TaxID=519541 RepID=A0AA35RJI1_GEOBA|nr:Lymphocyte expansion molecule [Geodia barretti]